MKNFWYTTNRQNEGTVTDFHEFVWAKHDENFQKILFYRDNPSLKSSNIDFDIALDYSIKQKMKRSKIFHDEIHQTSNIIKSASGENTIISDWRPIYKDNHTNSNSNNILASSKLSVKGKPLNGKPDIVLENKSIDTILIIETKLTNVPLDKLTRQAYPNNRAQLWAYGNMDLWSHYKPANILLAVNFWNLDNETPYSSNVWTMEDEKLNLECTSWFQEYIDWIIRNRH